MSPETAMTLPLVTPEQPRPPPRPRREDPAIIRHAAEAALPEVINWLGADWRESERSFVIEQLCEAIPMGDGFGRARHLADSGWDCDMQLAEILDGCDGHAELRAAVKQWVAANGITPKLAIGQRVMVETRFGQPEHGTIVQVWPDTAEYVVATDEYAAREPEQVKRGSAAIVAFERVVPISEPVATEVA